MASRATPSGADHELDQSAGRLPDGHLRCTVLAPGAFGSGAKRIARPYLTVSYVQVNPTRTSRG